jgi:GTPase
MAPIFLTSSVTGAHLDLLRMLLNLLPSKTDPEATGSPGEFHIDDTFQVTGVGAVVAGTMTRGEITVRSNLVMGPDSLGKFVPVQIKSIMNKRLPVAKACAGQSATFAVKKFKRNQFRKGMVVADAALNPRACLRFTAEVVVLHHHTTISNNYQPVVHCMTVTQSCRVVGMKDGPMRTGDRSRIDFEFLYRPEYIVLGERMIFREGRTKGIGKIVAITYIDGETVTLEEAPTLPAKPQETTLAHERTGSTAPLRRAAPPKSERMDLTTAHPVASECA